VPVVVIDGLTPVNFVTMPEDTDGMIASMEDSISRMDDAYWSRLVYRGFSWQRFLDWWIARRWIIPRDIRRE